MRACVAWIYNARSYKKKEGRNGAWLTLRRVYTHKRVRTCEAESTKRKEEIQKEKERKREKESYTISRAM